MFKKKLICLLFALLLLTGCSAGENESSYKSLDDVPDSKGYAELTLDKREEVCKFVYSREDEEIVEYIKKEYEEQMEKTEGIELKSINVYKDTLIVNEDGTKPLNNFVVELKAVVDMDNGLSEDDRYILAEEWREKAVDPVASDNEVALLTVKRTITTLIDEDTGKEYVNKASVNMSGDIFGIKVKQPEGEKEAMEKIGEVIKKDCEEYTKLNPTETYNRTRLDRFGVVDSEIYAEVTVHVPRDDDETVLKKLGEDMAAAIKATENYVKKSDANAIRILIHSSLLGELEYVFELQ